MVSEEWVFGKIKGSIIERIDLERKTCKARICYVFWFTAADIYSIFIKAGQI